MTDKQEKPKIQVENISCILPESTQLGGLFVGNIYGAQNPDILKQYRIRSVLTSSLETPAYDLQDIPFHLKIKAIDQDNYSIIDDLKQCFQFIERTRALTNVLVHCYAGVSRSVTIVVAYIMKRYNWNLQDALEFVKEKRIVAKPNDGFMRQLKQFEQTLPLKNKKNQSPSLYAFKSEDLNYSNTGRHTISSDKSRLMMTRLPTQQHQHSRIIHRGIPKQSNLTIMQHTSNQNLLQNQNFLSNSNTPVAHHNNLYQTQQSFFPKRNSLNSFNNDNYETSNGNTTPRHQIFKTINNKHSQIPIPSILKRMSSNDRKQSIKRELDGSKANIYTSKTTSQIRYHKTNPSNINSNNYNTNYNYNNNNSSNYYQEKSKTTSRIIRPKDLPGYKQNF